MEIARIRKLYTQPEDQTLHADRTSAQMRGGTTHIAAVLMIAALGICARALVQPALTKLRDVGVSCGGKHLRWTDLRGSGRAPAGHGPRGTGHGPRDADHGPQATE